jgi:hypothetical protein
MFAMSTYDATVMQTTGATEMQTTSAGGNGEANHRRSLLRAPRARPPPCLLHARGRERGKLLQEKHGGASDSHHILDGFSTEEQFTLGKERLATGTVKPINAHTVAELSTSQPLHVAAFYNKADIGVTELMRANSSTYELIQKRGTNLGIHPTLLQREDTYAPRLTNIRHRQDGRSSPRPRAARS